jgi:O-antigen ligase
MIFLIQKPNPLTIAQYLVIGGLVSIAISPPLANIFIALSLIATLSVSTIRNQLIAFFKTKLGYACIAFIAVLFSGLLYGIESNGVVASSIWGWRKFLMLPIATAIFMNAPHAKQRLVNTFWLACLILGIYSFFTFLVPTFTSQEVPGVVVRNHATQGLFFSVAAIIALANSLNLLLTNWLRVISGISVPFFISNIALIATGRSGYIALTVMLVSFLFLFLTKLSILKKSLICIISLMVLISIFANSPASRNRIELAKKEFYSTEQQSKETSVGYRLNFWNNSVAIVPNYYLFGTGTGGFEKAYAKQVAGKTGIEATVTGDPHNQYLKILIEHGIFGLLIFLSIIVLLFKQISTNPFKSIGLSTLLAFSSTSLFNSHFSTFNEGQFIWIFAGSLLSSEALSMNKKLD